MTVTSPMEQEKTGAGEITDSRKLGNHKLQNVEGSIRSRVLPHFIYNQDDTRICEERIVDPISLKKLSSAVKEESKTVDEPNFKPENLKDNTLMDHQDSLETTTASIENTEISGVLGDNESTDGSDGVADTVDGEKKRGGIKKRKSGKIDRTNLRKGKWTVEEEEFTTRIIHHFSTGLLTLPEGTTLRSYLAEKLKCDPMRITKKFAGASCLGKRVFHHCDQAQGLIADVEMAKAELAQLEHRFRLRVENGQSTVPLPPQIIPTMTQQSPLVFAPVPGHPAPAAVAASWLQSLATQMSVNAPPAGQFAQPPHQQYHGNAPTQWSFVTATPHSSAINPQRIVSAPIQGASTDAINMAWAQAAASLTPALSQLAAANLHQHQQQLQNAYDRQLQTYGRGGQLQQPGVQVPAHSSMVGQAPQHTTAPFIMAPPTSVSLPLSSNTFLKPAPLPIAPQPQTAPAPAPGPLSIAPQPLQLTIPAPSPISAQPTVLPIQPRPVQAPAPTRVVVPPVAHNEPPLNNSVLPRTKDEVDAGSMLMGFLNSLHKGFLEAKNQKDKEEREMAERELAWSNKAAAIAVMGDAQETSSGRTSQPADSSPEDSQSELGGKDPSSSEESDETIERSRGPPRKRHKSKVSVFTSRNVAAHTTRMDALHHAERHRDETYLTSHGNGGDRKK